MNDQSRGNGFLWALVGCGALLFVGLCVALGIGAWMLAREGFPQRPTSTAPPQGPTPGTPGLGGGKPPPTSGEPLVFTAAITEATGSISGRISRECRFTVEPPRTDEPKCRTQIVCDSLLLYGGPSAGFFPCRFDPVARTVSGVDEDTTSADGDAAMTVDSTSRFLRIFDDSSGPNGEFTLVGTIR